jgi:hypothetical protein
VVSAGSMLVGMSFSLNEVALGPGTTVLSRLGVANEIVEPMRQAAVDELDKEGGLARLIKAVERFPVPVLYGLAVGKGEYLQKYLDEIADRYLMSDDEKVNQFAQGYVRAVYPRKGWDWAKEYVEKKGDWSDKHKATFLANTQFDENVWDLLEELGPDADSAYWSQINVGYAAGVDFERAARKLCEHDRPHFAVDFLSVYLHSAEYEVPTQLALDVLESLIKVTNQKQIQWGDIGYDISKRLRKVYAFVMVLCFSRMLYVEFTRGMRIEELIRCHQNAFEYFGGWTHTILYDNMAQIRLPSGRLNPLMADFLNHHGIALKTCRAYRARTKGKVERTIRYLRGNFLKGREFADLADLQVQGTHWQEEVANKRIHDTTKQRPVDLFREEKLVPLDSAPRYFVSQRVERRVSAEGFVHVSGSRYSVPPVAVGKRVVVEQGEQRIIVRSGEIIIAEHERARRSGECVADPVHVAEMWKLSLARQEVPPKPPSRLLFQPVQSTPLAIYEEVLA